MGLITMTRKHRGKPGKERAYRLFVRKTRMYPGGMCCLFGVLIAVSVSFFAVVPPASGDSNPYPVFGKVTSCDDTSSFVGANVTVMNPHTGVVRYSTVSSNGYFSVTFGNPMGPDEWYHGDSLMVWVNGTGEYRDWQGSSVTQFDRNRAPPHWINITLCSTAERIPSPPENLSASLGFTTNLYWIELRWDPSPGLENDSAVTYHIYRGTNSMEQTYQGSTTGSRIFNDTHLPFNTTYYYYITAENTVGESPSSPLINVTTRLPPIAHFSIYPDTPQLNESILFIDSSHDPDGTITNWTWQITPGGTWYGEQVTYIFPNPGIYTVTLTVRDNTGDQDTATQTLSLSIPKDDTPGFAITALLLSLTAAIFLSKKRKKN